MEQGRAHRQGMAKGSKPVPVRALANPCMIKWARERANLEMDSLRGRFPRIEEWESGKRMPTVKQLRMFAKSVHVPFGFLYYSEPPDETTLLKDFRTVEGKPIRKPSPSLIETLSVCSIRQDWYREHARREGLSKVRFVGSLSCGLDPEVAGKKICEAIGSDFDSGTQGNFSRAALSRRIQMIENAGILVMISGVVGNSNKRKLDIGEFRGFAMVDTYAPLIFLNGNDSENAQSFTLAHEMAHICLGVSSLVDSNPVTSSNLPETEKWCNAVAAEVLAPISQVRRRYSEDQSLDMNLEKLSTHFKVSRQVILLRLRDCEIIDGEAVKQKWRHERAQQPRLSKSSAGGGDYYRLKTKRVSKRFADALIPSALEGTTLFRDALHMLDMGTMESFHKLARARGLE